MSTPFNVPAPIFKFTSAQQVAYEATLGVNHPAYTFELTDTVDAGKIFVSRNGLNVAFSVNPVSNSTATLVHNVVGGGTSTGVISASFGISNDPTTVSDTYVNLVQVTGNGTWSNDASLTTITANNLLEIDGSITITNNVSFTTLNMSSLASLVGTTTISACASLVNFTIGSSTLNQSGLITVSNCGNLQSFTANHAHMPSPSGLTMNTDIGLTSINLPNAITSGAINVSGCTNLTTLSAPNLTNPTIGGLCSSSSSVAISSLSFPAATTCNITLGSPGGSTSYPNLTSISLPLATSGTLLIGINNGNESMLLPVLTSVNLNSMINGDVAFAMRTNTGNFQSLSSISFPALVNSPNYFLISGPNFQALTTINLPSYTGTTALDFKIIGTFPNLTTLNVPLLTKFGGPTNYSASGTAIAFIAHSLTSFSLPSVTSINTVGVGCTITSNALNSVNLSSLTSLIGPIVFTGNGTASSGSSCNISSLVSSGASIQITGLGCTSIDLGALASFAGLTITSNPFLSSVNVANLTSSNSAINISSNPLLSSVSMPALATLNNLITVSSNASLSTLSVGAPSGVNISLAAATGPVTLNATTSVTANIRTISSATGQQWGLSITCGTGSVTIPTLISINSVFSPTSNGSPAINIVAPITTLSLPNCTGLGGYGNTGPVIAINSAALTTISLPSLTTLVGQDSLGRTKAFNFNISNASLINSVDLSSFTTMTNLMDMIIQGSASVTSGSACNIGALVNAPSPITINQTGCTSLDIHSLTSCYSLAVTNNPFMAAFSIPSLTTTTNGGVTITACNGGGAMVIGTTPTGNLTYNGVLTITSNVGTTSITVGDVSHTNVINGVSITANTSCATVTCNITSSNNSNVTIAGGVPGVSVGVLTAIDLSRLVTVGISGVISVTGNYSTVDLRSLTSYGSGGATNQSLNLSQLGNCNFSALASIGCTTSVLPGGFGFVTPTSLAIDCLSFSNNNTTTTTIAMDALVSTQGGIAICSSANIAGTLRMSACTSISFNSLDTINGGLIICGGVGGAAVLVARMDVLNTVNVPSLKHVNGNIEICALDSASVPTTSTTLTNPLLATVSFPALLSCGHCFIRNSALSVASVRAIIQRLAFMDGVNAGTTAWSSKTLNLSGGTSAGLAAAVTADPTTQAAYTLLTTSPRSNTIVMNA